MSYDSRSGYYGSSITPSNSGGGVYSSSRGPDGQSYPSQLNSSSGTQHMNYSTSNYNYSNAPSYTDNSNICTGLRSWRQDGQATNYDYQRSNTYTNQETASGNTYTSSTYTRQNTERNDPPNHARGLSDLAYASGLDNANSRSNNAQSAQRYESAPQSSYAAQDEMKSPPESQSRYAVNPPSTHTSYPMQTHNSSSSTSSQQQAINAAAALAGVVNRRYPPSTYNTTSPSNNSTVTQNNKFSVPNPPHRTSSPQVNTTAASQQKTSTAQKQIPHNTYNSRSVEASREAQTVPRSDKNLNRTSSSNTYRIQQSASSISSILSANQNIDHSSDQSSGEIAEPVPTSIDPARVFNPYHREHEMKRLQAEAEAKRRAEEEANAEELRKQKELAEQEAKRKAEEEAKVEEARKKKKKADQEAKQQQAKAQPVKKSNKGSTKLNPSAAAPSEDVSENLDAEEQATMAAEMKVMMEKMKAFRNRDPAFFQKMWEDIRKPGSNGTANSIQSPSPQLAGKPLPAGQRSVNSVLDPKTTQPQHTTPNVTIPNQSSPGAPDPNQNTAKNGYRVVVEDNPQGLADLGRFPAERRIRNPTYNRRLKSGGNEPETSNEATVNSKSMTGVNPNTASIPSHQQTPASATPAALSNMFPTAGTANASGASGIKSNDKQSSGTVWPVEKRTSLINTALKVLKSNPENARIHLTEAEFHEMLANNPSYIGLCEMLEKKGLRFHRNVFARDLLNSVPELEASSKPSSTPAGPVLAATPQPVNSLLPPPAARPAVVANQPPLPQYPPAPYGPQYGPGPTYHSHPQPPPHPPHPLHDQVPMTFVGVHPAAMPPQPLGPGHMPYTPNQGVPTRPEPIPGTKEAAARKRDFSELIDLTELGDNENYVMPNKSARLDGPDSDTEMETNPLKAFQTPNQMNLSYYPTRPGRLGQPHLPRSALHPNGLNGPNVLQPDGSSGVNNKMILAKPLNKSEALKKIYYDPKTVARDILIATGRHPSERPLNVHLAGMLGKYIELDSDVNTFDWDEIDPGGPPAPKVVYVDLPASKPRFKLGEKVRRRRGPKKPIDRPGQLVWGKRAMAKSGDQSAVSKTAAMSQLNSQTNTEDKMASQPLHLQARAVEKKLSLLRQSLIASTQEGLATPSIHDPTINRPSQTPNQKPSTSSPAMETPQSKRRGRPPGSKNKFPTVAGLKEQAIRVNVPVPEVTPSKVQDKFRCKWKKCNTVLHNLDTLRKHIGRVHRPTPEQISNEGYICWWKKCRFLTQDSNGDWLTVKSWTDWEEWLSHIEREHVAQIAMRWGDGPATQHIDPLEIQLDRQRYLSTVESRPDGSERLVETTPLISAEHNDAHPPDVLNLTRVHPDNTDDARGEAEVEALRYFMHAHKIKRKSRQASEEFIKAMEKRKEKIGPGMDRGGCTLITEDMRDTFVQNPGIRRVIKIDA